MKGQLRISRPAQRKPQMRRLTERQRALLAWMRYYERDGTVRRSGVATIKRVFGYADARGACERLVARGLVEKVRRGEYRAVVLRERSAYDARDGDRSAD